MKKRYLLPKMPILLIIFSLILQLMLIGEGLQSQNQEYPVITKNGKQFYEYTVKPSEGFYRIRVNFNITQEELILHNPHAKDGLQIGMKLLIPVNKPITKTTPTAATATTVVKANQTDFIEHLVQRKQTMFRICKMYSVTEEEILEHNPQIRGRSIQEGDFLRIPVKKEALSSTKTKDAEKEKAPVADNLEKSLEKAEAIVDGSTIIRARQQHYRIAFLLPFNLDQKNEPIDSRFTEFYAGALLAINQAKLKGRNIEVFTYDTEKSDVRLMEILTDSMLQKADLIVGPAYSNQVSIVCDFARVRKIKTLIPFTSKIYDLETNEYIYQFNPGQDTELLKLTEILTSDTGNSNLIFVENPFSSPNDESNQMVAQLKVLLRNARVDFLTVEADPSTIATIRPRLRSEKENILIFNTNRISSLAVQLRQLTQLSDSFNIKIYEPYSWRTAKADKPASFYLSVFRNEYPDKAYEEYMEKFSTIFNWLPVTEHPRYDLLGFDLLSYYFSTSDIPANLRQTNYPVFEGIQSTIRFEKAAAKGGYINKLLNHYE